MSTRRALVIDPAGMTDAGQWAEEAVRTSFPEMEVARLDAAGGWPELRDAARDRSAWWVLPFRLRFLRRPAYLRLLAFALLRVRARVGVVGPDGIVLHPLVPLLAVTPFLQPFVSFFIFLSSPIYAWSELLQKFALTREDPADPIVGFGQERDAGGVMYWTLLAEKARQYGIFGLAHDTYWGKPLSVHSWPLAVAALRALGYRWFTVLSALMIAGALIWLGVASGHAAILWALPLLFVSTFFNYNLFCGTWELLSWGFATLAVVSMWRGIPTLAGVFVGAAILAHPAVGALSALLVSLATFVFVLPATNLLIAGASSVPVALPFAVAYWRSREKLGRGQLLSEVPQARRWDVGSLYLLLAFTVLAAVAVATSSWRALAFFALPIVIHVVNTKVAWMFSKYTIFNLVMIIGAIHLIVQPSIAFAVVYAVVIFTSPMMLIESSSNPLYGFDLTPLTLGATGRRLRSMFGPLTAGRIAFEWDGFSTEMAYATATITYALAREPLDLFNAAYAEIGDAELHRRFVRCFTTASSSEELIVAIRESGSRYMVAYSDSFASKLHSCGLREISFEERLRLSHFVNRPPMRVTIFELNEPVSLVKPALPLRLRPNAIELDVRANDFYYLRFTAFKGWRADIDGLPVAIEDAKPGMIVRPQRSGTLRLAYRYRNYFLR